MHRLCQPSRMRQPRAGAGAAPRKGDSLAPLTPPRPCPQALPDLGATAAKVAASAALAALLTLAGPAGAKLDTDTFKAGQGATVEASQIGDESETEVVRKLKEIVPEIQARLAQDAAENGSGYPDSVIRELDTVMSEIKALERQARSDAAAAPEGSPDVNSSVKSTASGIEQQVNALKAILGFD